MNDDGLLATIIAGAVILFFIGFFVGMGIGQDGINSKWCERMKDTTWSECTVPGQQVEVIENEL